MEFVLMYLKLPFKPPLLFLFILLLSDFLCSVPVPQLPPRHRWDVISQIQTAAPGEQILCPHTGHGACLRHSTLCRESQISNQGKDDGQRRHALMWIWAHGAVCNVFHMSNHTRISGKRTQTTCVQTLWRCCGVATVHLCGSSSAWTPLPCSDGASCVPPSEGLLLLTKLDAPGLLKLQVRYLCNCHPILGEIIF